MNLSTKSTTTFLAFLAATSGVNAGCADSDGPGTTLGLEAAKEIVKGSVWFEQNCLHPMTVLPPQIDDAEAECKTFAINYCIGNMKEAVEELHCQADGQGTPPPSLMNTWSEECSDEVSNLLSTPTPTPAPTSYDPVKEGYKAGMKAIDDFYGGDKSKCWGLDKVAKKLNAEKFPANQGTSDERAYNQSASIASVREATKIMDSAECFGSASANFVHLRGNQK